MNNTTGYFKLELTVAVNDYYPEAPQYDDADYWTATALEWFTNILDLEDPKMALRALRSFKAAIVNMEETELELVAKQPKT